MAVKSYGYWLASKMIQQFGLLMQEYLDKNIKDVIREFPQVAGVLSRYDIGCVTCGLCTCLFKDIVEYILSVPGKRRHYWLRLAGLFVG